MATEEATEAAAPRERKAANPLVVAAQSRVVTAFCGALERAPWSSCRATGARFGLVFYYGIKRRREMAVGNVRLAFPAISEAAARQIARRSAQNFGMTFCEFMHLGAASAAEVRAYCDIEGLEIIQAELAKGRGVLLQTGHFGNWEVMGARVVQEFPLTAMSRPSSNSAVQGRMAALRQQVGINVISKFDTARAALKVLRANEALAIFGDQHGGAEGILLPFFGHPTRCIAALARLSVMSGAPIVPGFGIRRTPWLADGRLIAQAFPAIILEGAGSRDPALRDPAVREAAVVEGTRAGMQATEELIRRYPDQWLWAHRRWRPEDAADAAAAAAAQPDVVREAA